jgi:hypothetical protein
MTDVRPFFSIPLTLLVSVFLLACGSSRDVRVDVDAKKNQTTYETRSMQLSDISGFSGISKPLFESIVRGECNAVGCTPDTFDIVFRTNPGAERIQLQATDVALRVGDKRFHWEDPFSQPEGTVFDVRGTIVQVPCTLDQLKALSSGETVEGSLGGISFKMFGGNLDPIRSLIARVEGSSSTSS